ncbi:zinc-binding dehydrogenase [Aliiglaciecola lipolytica]|uniref:Quinone reductase, Qor_1 n=1 Tax=Aliiglaciecola lipolytica E3 TaxID=1127673 RepID=K6YH47_9ALTE|nr:zinc-binding dehydrogenase [Aliiglaciecola lipolytica]GAC15938.1 quinone reductase, Qor_1 [Aliiglaciecola lipolytica E3]
MKISKQLFTQISSKGELTISLKERDVPTLKPHEVLVEMHASPINPSDMWPMFGPANLQQGTYDVSTKEFKAPVPQSMLGSVKSRLDQMLPIGNEGAGKVVEAGSSDSAQALLGKTVGILSGATYSQYCVVPFQACIAHQDDTSARAAASSFVNPLTAMGMVETMRSEGHSALVHTAAASSLGVMLNKICIAENIPLVNIVRKPEQVEILKKLGAKHICNSTSDSFQKDLYEAIDATGATLAFDAIGGGELVSHILTAMERVGSKDAKGFNTYGSADNKQVYIYGGLDFSPTILNRAYGMTWGIGGWLLMQFLGKQTPEKITKLHHKVANEINTTFAIDFTEELTFDQVLQPEVIQKYMAKKTGEKFFLNPNAK